MEKQRSFEEKQSPGSGSESSRKRKKEKKSRKKDGEKASKKRRKEESNPCVIPALRLLIALEDYLGSIGMGLMGLLTEALRMEKERPGSSNDLLALERNTLIIETAKQKLKGGIEAKLITGRASKAAKKAIARARALLNSSVKAEASQKMEPVTSRQPEEETQRKAISPKLDALLDTNATDLLNLISDTIPDNIFDALTGDSPEGTPNSTTNTRTDTSIAEQTNADVTPSDRIYTSMMVPSFCQGKELTDEQLYSLLNSFDFLPPLEQINLVQYLATLEPSRVHKLRAALTIAVTRYDCSNPNAVSNETPTTSANNPISSEHLVTQLSTDDDLAMHATSIHQVRTNNMPDLLHCAGTNWNCSDHAERPSYNERDHVIAESASASAKGNSRNDSNFDVKILVPMPKIEIKEVDHVVSSKGLDDSKRLNFTVKSSATQRVNSMSEELLTTNDVSYWSADDFTDRMVKKKKIAEDIEGITEENNKKSINSISLKKLEIIKLLESVVEPNKAEKIYEMLKECSKEDVEEISAVSSTTDVITQENQSGEQPLRSADVEAPRPYCVLCQSNTHKLKDCILRNKHLCIVCQTYGYRTPNCPECSLSRMQKSRNNSERIRQSPENKRRSLNVYCWSNKYRKPIENTRYSQNNSSYRYQRTSNRYPTTADRSRISPEERRRSISPNRRNRNRSTDEPWKNRAPNRRRYRSPIDRHRSRSSNRLRSRSPSERRRSRSLKRLKSRSPIKRLKSRPSNRYKRSSSPDERQKSKTPYKGRSCSPHKNQSRPSKNRYRNNDLDECRKSSHRTQVTPDKYKRSENTNLFVKDLKLADTDESMQNQPEENLLSYSEKQVLTKPKQIDEPKLIFVEHNESDLSKQQPKKCDVINPSLNDVMEAKVTGVLNSVTTLCKCDRACCSNSCCYVRVYTEPQKTFKLIDPNELTPNPLDITTAENPVKCSTNNNEVAIGTLEGSGAIADIFVSDKLVFESDSLNKTQLSPLIQNESRNEIFLENNPVKVVKGREAGKQTDATSVSHDKDNIIMNQRYDTNENKISENGNNVARKAFNNTGLKIDVRVGSLKNTTTKTINEVKLLGDTKSNDNDKIFQKNMTRNVGNLIICEIKEQVNTNKTMNTVKTLSATESSESVASSQKCLNSQVINVANLSVCKTNEENTDKKTSKSVNEVKLDIGEKAEIVKNNNECQANEIASADNSVVCKTGDKSTVKPISLRKRSKRKTKPKDMFCPRCRVNTHFLKSCQAARKLICFRCGMDGVTRLKCPNCRNVSKVDSLSSYLSKENVIHTVTDVMGKTTEM